MTIAILFAISIIAVSILTWLARRRFTKYLPSKEAVNTFCLVAPVVLLLCVAVLPDLVLFISLLAIMPHYLKLVLGLSAAACIIYAGCSKQSDTSKPRRLHWSAPDTGFQSDTTLPPDPKPKEAP